MQAVYEDHETIFLFNILAIQLGKDLLDVSLDVQAVRSWDAGLLEAIDGDRNEFTII